MIYNNFCRQALPTEEAFCIWENITPELLHLFAYLKQSTEEVAEMHPDEKIRNIHERVKYLKRDRKLEAEAI